MPSVDKHDCHGKASITDTRIIVPVMLDNLAAGLTPHEIVHSYLTLSIAAVQAEIAFAADGSSLCKR